MRILLFTALPCVFWFQIASSFKILNSRIDRSSRFLIKAELSEASMTVDEIKSELEMRGIDYNDCISKNDLVSKLIESRTFGKAKPEILDKFNEYGADINPEVFNSEDISQVTAKDGNLPGGMSPELLKALGSDPEILQMLRDPKMQNIMRDVMTGGPDAMKKYLADIDAMLLLERLSKSMSKIVKP